MEWGLAHSRPAPLARDSPASAARSPSAPWRNLPRFALRRWAWSKLASGGRLFRLGAGAVHWEMPPACEPVGPRMPGLSPDVWSRGLRLPTRKTEAARVARAGSPKNAWACTPGCHRDRTPSPALTGAMVVANRTPRILLRKWLQDRRSSGGSVPHARILIRRRWTELLIPMRLEVVVPTRTGCRRTLRRPWPILRLASQESEVAAFVRLRYLVEEQLAVAAPVVWPVRRPCG